MAENLKMTPSEVRREAGNYDSMNSQVGDLITSMSNGLNQLEETWEGDAVVAFRARFEGDIKPAFQNAQTLLGDIAAVLRTSADNQEATEAANASAWK